jgi:hypothetical protein
LDSGHRAIRRDEDQVRADLLEAPPTHRPPTRNTATRFQDPRRVVALVDRDFAFGRDEYRVLLMPAALSTVHVAIAIR